MQRGFCCKAAGGELWAWGRVVLPRRAIARQQRARGEKEGNWQERTGLLRQKP